MLKIPCLVAAAAVLLLGCGSDENDSATGPGGGVTFDAPWPANIEAVLSDVFHDGEGDQEPMPPEQAGPPYSEIVPYPPVDVTRIAVGVDGDFLYMRVDYAGATPTARVHIPAAGEVEEQWVGGQGMNIALNVDADLGTGGNGEGVSGIDIFFAVGFQYGQQTFVYANWDFPDRDLHHPQHHADGELGMGGPGFDYAVVRYDVSQLGSFLPRGKTVDIGSWSEAESFTADGDLLYHHFAYDRAIDGQRWAIAAE